MRDLPLDGIRVIELCQNVAGPYATAVLSQLGANVTKIEHPVAGDPTRAWAPPYWDDESVMFAVMNAGKSSVSLDIDDEDDRVRLRDLVMESDVVVESFRPGSLERRGLGAADLRARNPGLVHCSISGFGSAGPLSREPGYDPILQAFSGLMSLTGETDRAPVRVGTSIIDMGTGMWAVIGILAALLERRQTGRGACVTSSLLETGLAWIPYQAVGYLATGEVPGRSGSGLAMLAPYQAFPTADRDLMIAAGNDSLWRRLCEAIDRNDLRDNPAYATNPQRVSRRQEIVVALTETLRTEAAQVWLDRLRAAGVPASLIQDVGEALAHPQTASLELVAEVDHPTIEGFSLLGLPFRLDGYRPAPKGPPPPLEERP
jgi:crotonobetainyl-CoA:carnitine CoA-transferase CaiB-like acyl-CoA transferase